MSDERLTKKEWDVLWYFIKNEGYAPGNSTVNGGARSGRESLKPYTPFVSYPAKIERDLNNTVTRVWASKICMDFEDMGIFGHTMIRPPRQKYETEHYFLKRDLETLRKVTRLVVDYVKPKDRCWVFSFRYFRNMINESLVKEVLFEKNVEMRRTIPLSEWNDADARRLYGRYIEMEAQDRLREQPASTDAFDMFMRSRSTGLWTGTYFSSEISLRLPVFSDSVPLKRQIEVFNALNEKELEKYPFIRFHSSGIERHYRTWQYEKLILPILVLVQISPNALMEFLHGDWKPYDRDPASFDPDGIRTMEYTIFKLIFAAISDLALTRDIAGDSIARVAWLRKSINIVNSDDQDALLTVSLHNGQNIYFDAGFDTLHEFYGSDDDCAYEPDEELGYWVKTWVGFDKDMAQDMLLTVGNIKDPAGLVNRLKGDRDLMSSHIMGKLSYSMQRWLRYYDCTEPSGELLRALLDELNHIIIGECIYDALAFKGVRLSEDVQKRLSTRPVKCDSTSDIIYNIDLNRSLLVEAFPGCLSKSPKC
ncbi:MAG: hypothetical protein ACM3QV_00195 [Caulobacteraceae bacterium]